MTFFIVNIIILILSIIILIVLFFFAFYTLKERKEINRTLRSKLTRLNNIKRQFFQIEKKKAYHKKVKETPSSTKIIKIKFEPQSSKSKATTGKVENQPVSSPKIKEKAMNNEEKTISPYEKVGKRKAPKSLPPKSPKNASDSKEKYQTTEFDETPGAYVTVKKSQTKNESSKQIDNSLSHDVSNDHLLASITVKSIDRQMDGTHSTSISPAFHK